MIIRVSDDRALLDLYSFLTRRECIPLARPELRAVEVSCPHLEPDAERRRIEELVDEWRRTREVA